jgi:lipid-binding SYLF domain-containing protein
MQIMVTSRIAGACKLTLAAVVVCSTWNFFAAVVSGQYAQPAPVVAPQNVESAIVESATQVLNEIMSAPAQGIPRALLHDAQAIVIAPGLLKGGFIIGVKHGRGVLVMHDDNGGWRAPSFITITGGSIGWQAGVQSTDVIMVFKTKQGVQKLINGKFTIGADVSAAAGPVGREASAATDIQLRAEIYSYSRSRGLFAGAALDGSVVSLDNAATAAYYRGTGILWQDAPPGHPPTLPPTAANLLATIAAYSNTSPPAGVPLAAAGAVPQAGAAPGTMPPLTPIAGAAPPSAAVPQQVGVAPQAGTAGYPAGVQAPALAVSQLPADLEAIRARLADSSRRLASHVDPRWQSYLVLPPEVYNPGQPAKADTIAAALNRFNAVAADPKYHALTQRPDFQETFGLLKAYRDLQTVGSTSTLALPPPP